MTTFTLTGFSVTYDFNEDPVGFAPATLDTVFPDATGSINYVIEATQPDDIPDVIINGADELNTRLNGGSLDPNLTSEIGQITTPQGTHIVLVFEAVGPPDVDHVFIIGGDPVTMPTSLAEFITLEGSISAVGPVTSGPFRPGVDIPLTSFLNQTSSENDLINGDGTSNAFAGGVGDDTLNGFGGNDTLDGGAGDDQVSGGSGNDVLNPGDNVGGATGFDVVTPGQGNDIISFADVVTGWVNLNYNDLGAGITVTLDGGANTGTVNKGLNGFDTLIDVENPLNSGWTTGGLAFNGSNFNDTFNVSPDGEQWMDVRGLGGNDTINVNATNGAIVRASYFQSFGAVTADLGAGTILQDGFTDTITGNLWEVRASDNNDSLLGSAADESFIGRAGNDTIDGAGGFDRARYDRSGNDGAINADLGAGTVTGQWNGSGFTDTISNIEQIRGTNFNDSFTGTGGGQLFEGRGGNDTMSGGNGNDTLRGGDGADQMDGGAGTDVADYSDATAKILIDLLNLNKNTGEALGDTYTSVETFVGTDFRDFILADDGRSRLEGGLGNDDLRGRSGRDTMLGGEGEDALNGGKGRDRLEGGADNDLLRGITGLDNLLGGKGDDTLEGGAHNDRLTGGKNNDTFVFEDGTGDDTITDFDALNNAEKIDFSGVSSLNSIGDVTGPGGAASQVGSDVLIDLGGGNSVLLQSVSLGDLDNGDFMF